MRDDDLSVEGLSLEIGGFALRNIDLTAAGGETLVLFGPNGAGKSMTLEAIAGFRRPRAGRVFIAGEDATALPPERRGVGLVPQNYGLLPNLTVAANVMLPLRAAGGIGRRAARERADELLARFGIAALTGRLPGTLSPGERQRTALARALAARPRVLLFDEPFSALDAVTRETLRDELRAFLRNSGVPAVFVTHELAEAMAIGDRIAVMRGGRILQQGPAREVYRRPAGGEIAGLLGVENILSGRILGQDAAGWLIAVGDAVLRAACVPACAMSSPASLAVRAEEVTLLPPAAGPDGTNCLAATVRGMTDNGALVKIVLDCGFPLIARLTSREARPLGLAPGRPVIAKIAPAAIRVLRSPE